MAQRLRKKTPKEILDLILESGYSGHYELSDENLEYGLRLQKDYLAKTDQGYDLSDGGSRLRARIESFEREIRRRRDASGSPSVCYPGSSELRLVDIFISMPPKLRSIYDKLEKDFQFYVQRSKLDGVDKSEMQSNADDAIRNIRKLCVDPSLLELEETPITQFLEGIRSVPPLLAESHNHPQDCRKCGSASDVIFTACNHPVCVKCIRGLLKDNKVRCHVCKHEIKSFESWNPQKMHSSKYEAMIQLLTEHPGKSIILCEFGKPLRNLQIKLRSLDIQAKICRGTTSETSKELKIGKFCNLEKNVRVLLATFGQIDFLAKFNFNCASKIYVLSAIPKTLEEKAISLIRGPGKMVEVYKLISNATMEARIFGTDIGRIDKGKLAFSLEEFQWLLQI